MGRLGGWGIVPLSKSGKKCVLRRKKLMDIANIILDPATQEKLSTEKRGSVQQTWKLPDEPEELSSKHRDGPQELTSTQRSTWIQRTNYELCLTEQDDIYIPSMNSDMGMGRRMAILGDRRYSSRQFVLGEAAEKTDMF